MGGGFGILVDSLIRFFGLQYPSGRIPTGITVRAGVSGGAADPYLNLFSARRHPATIAHYGSTAVSIVADRVIIIYEGLRRTRNPVNAQFPTASLVRAVYPKGVSIRNADGRIIPQLRKIQHAAGYLSVVNDVDGAVCRRVRNGAYDLAANIQFGRGRRNPDSEIPRGNRNRRSSGIELDDGIHDAVP